MFNGSVFYFQCFFSLLHTKAEAKKNLHDLSETSFCSHEPLFRTFPFPHFHRFSMAVISMPMPTVREGEKERKIFLPFFFCCLMQTSFEAGYCVIRISENRYRISRFRAPRGVSVVLSDTSRHCSRTDLAKRILRGEMKVFLLYAFRFTSRLSINRCEMLWFIYFSTEIHSINLLSFCESA